VDAADGRRRQSRMEYRTKMVDFNCVMVRAVFDGGLGVDPPPRKFLTPPAAIKKRKGGRLSIYLCISTVVDFNSQNFDPPNEI